MRWACVFLPHLAVDAVQRQRADAARPFALVEGPAQRRTLHAVNTAARDLGLRPGMPVVAARALAGDDRFDAIDHDPGEEARAQALLAAWAYGYSSQVSLDFPRALVLEIGASRALFGDWPAIERRLRADLDGLGFRHRLVAAPNPHAARVLAAVHDGLGVEAPRLERALGQVPVARAGLPRDVATALARSGLHRLAAVFALPRETLARRFPPTVLAHLDRLRGHRQAPLGWFAPPDRFEATIEFAHEVESSQALLFPLRRLTADLAAFLAGRDGGVQRYVLCFAHEDRPDSRLDIGLLAPEREAGLLFELARSRLDHLRLPAATRALRLVADELPAFVPAAGDLFDARPQQAMAWPQLRERLRARLGEAALQELRVRPDHRPECATQRGAGGAGPGARKKPGRGRGEGAVLPAHPPRRPAWLLERPLPLRGEVERLGPPERIESGWWDGGDVRRDYYVVRTRQGQQAWAFAQPGETAPLMLHGWFA